MTIALSIVLAASLLLAIMLLVNEVRYADRLRKALNGAADAICKGKPNDALAIAENALEGWK